MILVIFDSRLINDFESLLVPTSLTVIQVSPPKWAPSDPEVDWGVDRGEGVYIFNRRMSAEELPKRGIGNAVFYACFLFLSLRLVSDFRLQKGVALPKSFWGVTPRSMPFNARNFRYTDASIGSG